ncbi:response regulator transcription factor [Aestuariivirga litoralis]|uniref:response regulator transcription factor n=1 Tax=Aestuariivirga litoralis TaxID=2650924 RepID=UPI001874537D|nr:response regulator transcription factor [Aestuariivirga litoralis]
MTDIRSVIVADPNTIMLQALSELFERDRRFSLVATSKTAEGFLESCLRVPVDIGIVDWTIPQLGAERLLGILRDRPDAPRIIVYSASGDPDVPRRAMAAGAAAFLARDAPEQQLLDVAASVAAGRMVFPFMDVRSLKRDPRDSLTEREKTLLAALAKGRTNTELAAELDISINTVKFHLRNLYEKLGLNNRSQAIAFFYANAGA